MLVTIDVTKEDIEDARSRLNRLVPRSLNCPISIAARRVFVSTRKNAVATGVSCIFINRVKVALPDYVVEWVQAFDNGEFVNPLTFTIDAEL